jgi:hypothetical protein
MNRRTFIKTGTLVAITAGQGTAQERQLAGEVGITTGSFSRHLAADPAPGKLRMLDLPKLMREEFGFRVMDLMTATLASLEPAYMEQLRSAADRAGCVLTNLKMNQKGLDMASPDAATRRHALDEYKRTITAAAPLGVRWVRPLPGLSRPDLNLLAACLRELADHGARFGIGILVENFGWIKDDPNAIPAIIAAAGGIVRAQPDTGNWTAAARYDGLAKAFPLAASCDFKAIALGPDGFHEAYDLHRCFRIGWDAGFRGPWCIEHGHADLPTLLRGLRLVRNQVLGWMKEAGRE